MIAIDWEHPTVPLMIYADLIMHGWLPMTPGAAHRRGDGRRQVRAGAGAPSPGEQAAALGALAAPARRTGPGAYLTWTHAQSRR